MNFCVSRRLYVASSYDTLWRSNFDRNFDFLLENDIFVTFFIFYIFTFLRYIFYFYPLNISLLYYDYFTRFYVLYRNTRFADFWNSELKKPKSKMRVNIRNLAISISSI